MHTPARLTRHRPAWLRAAVATLVASLAACVLLRTQLPPLAAAAPGHPGQDRVALWQPTTAPAILESTVVELAAPLTVSMRAPRPGGPESDGDEQPATVTRLRVRLAARAHAACARSLARAQAGPLQTRSTSPPAIS